MPFKTIKVFKIYFKIFLNKYAFKKLYFKILIKFIKNN